MTLTSLEWLQLPSKYTNPYRFSSSTDISLFTGIPSFPDAFCCAGCRTRRIGSVRTRTHTLTARVRQRRPTRYSRDHESEDESDEAEDEQAPEGNELVVFTDTRSSPA